MPTAPRAAPRRRTLMGLLLGAGVAGCSVLPDRPYLETRRFPLLPRRPNPPARRGGRKVLLIRLMRAAPGLDLRGLKTRRADGSEDVDFYNEWVAPPAELVEEALRRWLTDSGLFSAVTAPGSRAQADLVLELELTQLIADLPRGVARAELAGVLLAGSGGRVLTQLTPRGEVPLRSADGSSRDPGPEAVAAGMTAALSAALARLERVLTPFA